MYSASACRAHLRTHSRSVVDVQPISHSSAHTTGSEAIQLRPSLFGGMASGSEKAQLATISEQEPRFPKVSALGIVQCQTPSVERVPGSLMWSLVHRAKLQERLYQLVFLFSLLAFLGPLAGIGYQPLDDKDHLHHIHLSAHLPRPQPSTRPFPVQLTPISPEDSGPLFANVLETPDYQPTQHGAVDSYSDNLSHTAATKLLLEPHHVAKPELFQAADDDDKHHENIVEELSELADGNSEPAEDEVARPTEDESAPPAEAEHRLTTDQKSEDSIAPRSLLVKVGINSNDEVEEEEPEISDDSDSPEEFAFHSRMISKRDDSSDDIEEMEESEVEEADLKAAQPDSSEDETDLDLEETESQEEEAEMKFHDPKVKQQRLAPESNSKTKELESLLQSLAPAPDHFPSPAAVEAISGRKGLRVRQFR